MPLDSGSCGRPLDTGPTSANLPQSARTALRRPGLSPTLAAKGMLLFEDSGSGHTNSGFDCGRRPTGVQGWLDSHWQGFRAAPW